MDETPVPNLYEFLGSIWNARVACSLSHGLHGQGREPVQSNDKFMPNSCLGQNLLVDHHGIADSRNSCLSHAQILKHHGIAYV